MNLDQDAVVATADLVGRAGARELEIGYLHDDVPAHLACWYAHAQYRGTRIIEENHRGPVEAMEALARRILTGAKCRCGKLVALSDQGAIAYDAHMADGSFWTTQDAKKVGQCRWRREGPKWIGACGAGARTRQGGLRWLIRASGSLWKILKQATSIRAPSSMTCV